MTTKKLKNHTYLIEIWETNNAWHLKIVSSFSYKFFIPSSELRTAVSNSKTASLAFPSIDKNTMRALLVLSKFASPSSMYCIYP